MSLKIRKSLRTLYEVVRFKAQERFMFEVIVLKLFILLGWFVRGVMETGTIFMAKGSLINKRNVTLGF